MFFNHALVYGQDALFSLVLAIQFPTNNETTLVRCKSRQYKLLTLIIAFPFLVYAQTTPEKGLPAQDTTNKAAESLLKMMNTVSSGTQGSIERVATDSLVDKLISPSALQNLVNYHSEDSLNIAVAENKAYLFNKAHIDYGNISLDAGYIELDWAKNEVYARGIPDSTGAIVQRPIFKQGEDIFETDEIRYNFSSNKALIRSVITKEGESYLHGEVIKRIDENTFYIKGTAFTTCNKRHPHYHVGTNKAKVIVGSRIITGPAMLVVSDVPTPVILPFGFFPAQDKRASGFIMPTYAKHEGKGLGLVNGGYYFSLSDHYDLALTGEIYSRGGHGLRAQSRYKTRYKYYGDVEARYNRTIIGDPRYEAYDQFTDSRDFRLRWNHAQDPKARPDFVFTASVDLANPGFNKYNAQNDTRSYLQNTTTSSISTSKRWLGTPFSLNASANHSQNNNTKDFSLGLPKVSFTMTRIYPFQRKNAVGAQRWYEKIGMQYSTLAEANLNSNYDTLALEKTSLNSQIKTGMQHNIAMSTSTQILKNLTFSPSINYGSKWYASKKEYSYDANNVLQTDTVSGFNTVNTIAASAQITTKIYGLFLFKKGPVKAIRHMITPNVNLSYQPDYTRSFWGQYQIFTDTAGNQVLLDRNASYLYGGSNGTGSGNVGIQLGNNLEMKVRSKNDTTGERKVKILDRLNFSTNYNIAAEQFNWSNLGVTAQSSLLKNKLQVSYQGSYDFYGYDPILKKRINKSAWEVNKKLLRNVNSTFTIGTNWGGTFGKGTVAETTTSTLGIEEDDPNWFTIKEYMPVNVPWSVGLNYNLSFTAPGVITNVSTHALSANFTINPTPNWSLVASTGYDLVAKEITYTQFNIVRDLHCWEMRISWIPFGFNQSYMIGLNIKASSFRDAKLERRRNIGDF